MRQKSRRPSHTVAAMIAATLFAKALGLVRSALLARTLGDLPEAAAFAAASSIPTAIFDILFSAAITGAFIPAYSAARAESEECAKSFSRAFLGAGVTAAGIFALAGVLLAPAIIRACAPNMAGGTAALAVRLLRIMFPSAVFTAWAYTLAGLLQARGSFLLPAAVSALSNACVAAYIYFSGARFSVYALAAVYVFSWLLQLLTLALQLLYRNELPTPRLDLHNGHLLCALRGVPKIAAGAWLAPAQTLAAAFFCSFVSEGAFAVYGYASALYTVAAGVAVYGVGNHCFPALAASFALGEHREFARRLEHALFSALSLSAPVFAAAAALAPEVVALLFVRGNFTARAAEECALALRALAPAIPAHAVAEVLYRAFCAAKKPCRTALSALFSAVVLLAASSVSLIFGGGLFVVCAAVAASEWARAAFLFLAAKKHLPAFCAKNTAVPVCGAALCLVAMAFSGQIFPFFSLFSGSVAIFLKITIVFTVGLVVYLLYILVYRAFARKIGKEADGILCRKKRKRL